MCRQSGESVINDWQIVKFLDEKKILEFFNLHSKQANQIKYMIACDVCEEWFHYECIGIKINSFREKEKYLCRSNFQLFF